MSFTEVAIAPATATSSIALPNTMEYDGYGRVVRFDAECVLIPDSEPWSKRPRLLTKSYSLPLWRRKAQQLSDSEGGDDTTTAVPPSPEETHVVLKLPIPTFRKKPSLSPSRGRSTSSSPPNQPLSPCLVHRMPSAPSSKHRASPVRRPSLPIYHQPKDSAKTVPLRPCCPDCERITEESLQQGSDWQEQFSRGARRRRSASLDNSMVMSSVLEPGYVTSATHHIEPALISRYPTAGSKFLITVDEVDKRRKSLEVTEDDAKRTRSVSPFRLSTAPSCSRLHPHERDSSGGSSFDDLTVDDARRKPRASPIQEEDEAQLFPLPSPRRSPNSSPASSILLSQSPKASPSPSPSPSQKNTPAPSPNASATFLGDLNDGKLSGSLTRRSVGDVVTSRANEPTVKNEPSMKPVMASVLSRPLSVHELPPSNSTNSVTPMPESVPTPTHSPIMSTKAKTKQRKSSFSLPFIKAGTDALKGVSSMSGGVFGSP